MYAIVETGGKQYRVQEGEMFKVEKLPAEIGTVISLDKVLLVGGEKTVIGTPLVPGAVVSCKVVNQDKEKKILVFHYKAKKNIRKRYGHRQPFTGLLVEQILLDGAAATPKAVKTVKAEQAAVAEVASEIGVKAPKTAVKKTAAKANAEQSVETVKPKAAKTAEQTAKTTAAKRTKKSEE